MSSFRRSVSRVHRKAPNRQRVLSEWRFAAERSRGASLSDEECAEAFAYSFWKLGLKSSDMENLERRAELRKCFIARALGRGRANGEASTRVAVSPKVFDMLDEFSKGTDDAS